MILITEQVKLGRESPNMALEDPNIEDFSLESEEEMSHPTLSPTTIPPSSPSEQQYIAFSSERQSNSLSEQQSDFLTEKQKKKLSSQDKQQQQQQTDFLPSSQPQIPTEPQQQNRCFLQGRSEGAIFNQSSQEVRPRFTLGSPIASSTQENDLDDAQHQSTNYSQEDESLVLWRQEFDELLLQVFGSDLQKKLSSQDKQQQQQADFLPSSQPQIPNEPQQQNRCLLQGRSEGQHQEIFNQSSQELHPRFTLGSPVVSSNSQENDLDNAQHQSTQYSQEPESLVLWRQELEEMFSGCRALLADAKNNDMGEVTEIPSPGEPGLNQSVPGIGGGVEVSTLVPRESPTRPASLTNSTTPATTTTTPNEPNQERLEPTIIKRSPLALEMLKFTKLEQMFRQIEEKKQQVERNKDMMTTSAQEDAMLRDLREAEERIGQHLQAQRIKVGKLALAERNN